MWICKKSLKAEGAEKFDLLLEILTPVVKTYPSEMGIQSISQGLQCLGGSGYCDDYKLEQYFRDSRIHPIHEGTTGIQGMDLLGRKVTMKNGAAFRLYIAEVEKAIAQAKDHDRLKPYADMLLRALARLQEVTGHLLEMAGDKGPEIFLADATLYLEYFGIITIAWQWLLQGIAVEKAMGQTAKKTDENFYTGKWMAMKFFFAYELPKTLGLIQRLMDPDPVTVNMRTELIND
jgi:hypothetical protein